MKTTLTMKGVARLLKRGAESNFNPDSQKGQLQKLAELLSDMAMSRSMDAEVTAAKTWSAVAERDAYLLSAIADELESMIGE